MNSKLDKNRIFVDMNEQAFSHLKVIEIASVLAGPSVGMFFAELGARVIKFENKLTGGDVTRSWRTSGESNEATISAYFCAINYLKEYRLVDFRNKTDMQALLNEIQTADILIANFKKGDAEKFNLDFDSLKKINNRIIYGEISGFGEESDRVAYDLILQAESGFMSMNGTPDSGPVKMPVALIDVLAGHQLKEGILVAMLQREREKCAQRVHVSLYDSAIASLANQASNWLMTKHEPARIGSKHPNIAPYGDIFETADGKLITLAVGSDQQFGHLCIALNIEYLANEEKFATNPQRVKNRNELEKILRDNINSQRSENLIEILHQRHVPVALIKSMREVFEDKAAQSLVRQEFIEGQLTRRVGTTVFKISRG